MSSFLGYPGSVRMSPILFWAFFFNHHSFRFLPKKTHVAQQHFQAVGMKDICHFRVSEDVGVKLFLAVLTDSLGIQQS